MEKMQIETTTLSKELLEELGYSFVKEIPGKGFCGLCRQAFTVGLFYNLDESGYSGRYCFNTAYEALMSLAMWNGQNNPPGNWIKHKGYGCDYRNPNYEKE